MSIVHLTEQDFDGVIQENRVVFVDFWAAWCGPCRMIAPFIEKIAEKYEGKAVIAKVDIDQAPKLAERFGVMSIPTVMLFVGGELKQKETGAKSQAAYEKMVDAVL